MKIPLLVSILVVDKKKSVIFEDSITVMYHKRDICNTKDMVTISASINKHIKSQHMYVLDIVGVIDLTNNHYVYYESKVDFEKI